MNKSIQTQAWEQQPFEPDTSYFRFSIYLYLGVNRTLQAAYEAYLDMGLEKGLVTNKSKKKPQIPGNWSDDSKQWNWVSRASQWDIYCLTQHGKTVIANFYTILGELSFQLLEEIRNKQIRPRNFAELVSGVQALGNFITPGTVQEWANQSKPDEPVPSDTEITKE